MAPLLAILVLRLKTEVKRALSIYGLMTLAALAGICAFGYAIDAGHPKLAFDYGKATASLAVAACLIVVAAGCVVGALIMRRRPNRDAHPGSSP